MDLFSDLSQDEMKELDEVLQSDHTNTLLQDTAVTHGATDEGVLMNASIESLGTLSDLDNLEPGIPVTSDVDLVNIGTEIFCDTVSKPVESHILQDHSYCILSYTIHSENAIKDTSCKAIEVCKTDSQVNGQPTLSDQSQKLLEKEGCNQKEDTVSLEQSQKLLEKEECKEEDTISLGPVSSKSVSESNLDLSESKLTSSKGLSVEKLLDSSDTIQQCLSTQSDSAKEHKLQTDANNVQQNNVSGDCSDTETNSKLPSEVNSQKNNHIDSLDASDNDDSVQALKNAVVSILSASVCSLDVSSLKNTKIVQRRFRVKSADSKSVSPTKRESVNKKGKPARRNTVNSKFPIKSSSKHVKISTPSGAKQVQKSIVNKEKCFAIATPQKKLQGERLICDKNPRKKSHSLSEDKTEVKSGVEGKKRHLSASEKVITPNKMALVKPKLKPRRRVVKNELLTADLLGPALFSQPDVLIKVKTAEEVAEAKKQVESSEGEKTDETGQTNGAGKKSVLDELSTTNSVPLQKPIGNVASEIKPGTEILADLKSILPEEKNSGSEPSSVSTTSSEESNNLPSKKPEIPTAGLGFKPGLQPQRTLVVNLEKCDIANVKDLVISEDKETSSSEDSSSSSSDEDDSSNAAQDIVSTVKESSVALPSPHVDAKVTEPPKPGRKSLRTIQRNKRFDDDDYSPERPTRGRKSQANKNAVNQKTNEESKEITSPALKPATRRTSGRAATAAKEKEDSEDIKSESDEESESSEEYDSEDDPNKIWCICRKPHNNKFMIECDKCKDWFHGTCVNVTRQLGRQLEKEGKEWVCPNCTKVTAVPALKRRTPTTIEIQSAANKAAKRQKLSLSKEAEATKETEMPQPKKNPQPVGKKDEDVKPNGANIKAQPSPKETKPKALKPVTKKPLLNSDKAVARNPIPKDFVLKSRDPTRDNKRTFKEEKSPAGAGLNPIKPEKILKLEKPLTPKAEKPLTPKAEKPLTPKTEKPITVKIEKPITPKAEKPITPKTEKPITPKTEKAITPKTEKTVKPIVKTEKIAAKIEKDTKANVVAKSETPKTGPESVPQRKKIFLREVTMVNNKVVKERSIVAVQHAVKEEGTNSQTAVSTTGSLRNMNEKPKSVFKSSVIAMKEAKKEAVKRRYSCILCTKPAPSGSVYCSSACLEKSAVDAIKVIQNSLKPNEELNMKKVDMIDRETGNFVTGPTAPTVAELVDWLKSNQMFSIVHPVVTNRKEQPQKTEPKASERSDDEDAAKESIRKNVRKTLKKILFDRCSNADDLKMTEAEVEKISSKIELELHNYFKDNSIKYRTKYRSLMFNIKDPRNQGLFRKILTGNIPPSELVRMSPDQLASVELAKWREKENQHSLEMIKRMQIEQNQGVAGLRKKTHKGEIEIEDDATLGLDPIDVDKELPKAPPKPVEETIEMSPEKKEKVDEKEAEKDTTMMHRSHLFDHNCKICMGKMAPPPPEESTPKKIRVAHSISIEQTSPRVSEAEMRITTTRTSISEMSDDSIDREPSSTTFGSPDSGISSKKGGSSLWKGFIMMQDVAKFFSSAHKVSGTTDSLFTDIPDNLQVCGRINPQQVWDYLSKVKQSGRQELCIVSFRPANEEEAKTYNVFYNYLNSRKRCGVVNQNYSKLVKDFYILPLAAHTPVPTVLLPFDGPGLPSHRPHLLLGVLVRHRGKQKNARHDANINQEKSDDTSFTPPHEVVSYTPPLDGRSYTPPPVDSRSFTSPLDASSNTPPLGNISLTSPLEEGSYTPPLEEQSFTPPLHERSYTPPLEGMTPPSGMPQDDNAVTSTFSDYRPIRFRAPTNTKNENKTDDDMEADERSYTPPLEGMPKPSRNEINERPYKPIPITTGVSSYRTDSGKNVITEIMRKLKENSTPLNSGTPNLERHRVILNDLLSKVQKTDLEVIQSSDDLEKLKAISRENSDTQGKNVNNVVSPGMSSFLTMPKKNLQDILNRVKPNSQSPDTTLIAQRDTDIRCFRTTLDTDIRSFMGERDTDIRTLPNYSPIDPNDPESPDFPMDDIDDRGSSQDATPPLCDEECVGTATQELRPSDPRIKIRTNFTEESSPSEELKKTSLSHMSTSELVERAQKELEAITPSGHYSVPNWDNCKDPPPPGIDPADLSPAERASFHRSNATLVGAYATPPLPDGHTVTSPFATTPTTPSAFTIPPPGYSLQAPPPTIPVNTSFPPPVLPPGFIPPPSIPPPLLVQPLDGRDERNDPYFQWHPDGPPPDMDYHDRHWKKQEYSDWDNRRGDRQSSEDWYHGRGHSGRDNNDTRRPRWRYRSRGLSRGRWANRRTRHGDWRRRAILPHPPRE